jgi:hypothetical protein
MKLSDLIDGVSDAPATNNSDTTAASPDTSGEEVEKVASMLDALSEEDTLLDELAKLAVIADLLDPEKRGNANA